MGFGVLAWFGWDLMGDLGYMERWVPMDMADVLVVFEWVMGTQSGGVPGTLEGSSPDTDPYMMI